MKRQTRIGRLLVTALLIQFLGCDPYSYIPARKQTAPPPSAGAEPASSPAPAESPPPPAEVRVDVNQQLQALEARVKRLEGQLAELEQRQGYPPPAKVAAPKAGVQAAPPPPPATTGGAQDKNFQEGMRLYNAKKYSAAREKFASSLKSHPQGGKAAEARYYLADSFYQEKKFKEAAVEYNKLVHQQGQSVLAPAAMLRQALCYHNLQQKQNYQATLKKLVQAYPQSAEAKEAQKWLKSEGR